MHRIIYVLLALLLAAVPRSPANAEQGLLVQRSGQQPRSLSVEQIAALPAISQHAAIEHDDREWTGPLLWDVLANAGAVDPTKPADAVHLVVRVIGADGWTAVFGLAELSPQFVGKPIQLADRMNGEPIPNQGLRLIVPGERRGGRSVRDVVRVEVD